MTPWRDCRAAEQRRCAMLVDYPLTVLAIVFIVAITGFVYLKATDRRDGAEKDEHGPK
jgi:hypothetical protein